MLSKSVVICSEILKPNWRWVSKHFPSSYHCDFYCAKRTNNKFLTIVYRVFTSLSSILKGRKADVIVSHGPYMAFYCAFFIWLFRVKTPHVTYSFNFAHLPKGIALKRMQFFFKKIDCLVVSSLMERTLYSENFSIPIEKIDFVRWGVAAPDFDLKPSLSSQRYISAVGGNARDYNLFMEAMSQLPEIQAIVVMRPHNLEGLNIPKNVDVLTDIPKDEALSVIKHSMFTVLPLVGTETPCGHVTIVVAMYLGVPCIVTESTGVSDYLIHEETGLLCTQNSLPSLIEAIRRLECDSTLTSTITTKAEKFASKECSEKNYAIHFQHFVERVIS